MIGPCLDVAPHALQRKLAHVRRTAGDVDDVPHDLDSVVRRDHLRESRACQPSCTARSKSVPDSNCRSAGRAPREPTRAASPSARTTPETSGCYLPALVPYRLSYPPTHRRRCRGRRPRTGIAQAKTVLSTRPSKWFTGSECTSASSRTKASSISRSFGPRPTHPERSPNVCKSVKPSIAFETRKISDPRAGLGIVEAGCEGEMGRHDRVCAEDLPTVDAEPTFTSVRPRERVHQAVRNARLRGQRRPDDLARCDAAKEVLQLLVPLRQYSKTLSSDRRAARPSGDAPQRCASAEARLQVATLRLAARTALRRDRRTRRPARPSRGRASRRVQTTRTR